MFMKAVLRTRELPFIVTDIDKHEQTLTSMNRQEQLF